MAEDNRIQEKIKEFFKTARGKLIGFFLVLAIVILILVQVWGYLVKSGLYNDFVKTLPDGRLFSLQAVFSAIPDILKHLPMTLGLTIWGSIFGLILALLFAIVKINRVPVLYQIQAFFVSFLRGTPILVQLMLTYYGIPLLLRYLNMKFNTGWNINNISPIVFAVVAFALNEAAYTSETIRAAIQAVDAGEIEAAKSLGMTNAQIYRRVIIPNAAVIATPTLINTLISLTKGTSLAFSAGIIEMFAQAKIIGGRDYRYFERYISVAIIYWIVSIVIENIGRYIEKSMEIKPPENISGQEGGLR
ncbi:amino acid ABC transporter permease [Streptococcus downei]|uniref:Amino acid ABC transporter, permease n=1 Tax=Streptococcus downei MFe28 TaxID=764290 RepID=A0A380JF98_STRDO|nr:amino acid ABC transporter permease [Streptococcus downei]EFQ56227.1 ABC transporter, permease protein [Streptococcus downei F0415]SUN35696.1 amino acid ABC transporter, permease [Streptococcus downei MFe28]